MMKNRYTFLLFLAFMAVPFLADACPMCQGGTTGGTVQAYRGTTIFLVLLPFISGWMIYRFVKKEME